MVLLKDLNNICNKRKAAKGFPSQVICRLLGNSSEPCKLNKICEQSETKGLWYLYTVILLFALLIYLVVFWLLKITKLSKLTYPLTMALIVPLEWLATSFGATIKFLRNFPF